MGVEGLVEIDVKKSALITHVSPIDYSFVNYVGDK